MTALAERPGLVSKLRFRINVNFEGKFYMETRKNVHISTGDL